MLNIIGYRKFFFAFSGIMIILSIAALLTWNLNYSIDFTGGAVSEITFDSRPDKKLIEEILRGLSLENSIVTPSGDKEFIIKTSGLMGGSISEISFVPLPDGNAIPDDNAIKEALRDLDLGNVAVTPKGSDSVLIKTKTLDEDAHQKMIGAIAAKFPDAKELKFDNLALDEDAHQKMIGAIAAKFPDAKELKFDSIGPVIGREMKQKSIWAIVSVAIGISLYVAWAFRKVTRPISSWKYGIVSIFTLFHDVIVPIGLFAFLGHYWGVQADLTFIVAVLTILGYSINDTIVVFDRTRENLLRYNIKEFEETVNKSLNQTLIRSINTGLTVVIALVCLYFFGGETLKYFALALLAGVVVGTYSSVFIASPLLVEWHKRSVK
ncbi:protein translocase subunit SecF [Patescibacteria group bacterium]|nr:protein translocase subunit SecF [Patescibacteria group bacterium]